MKTMNTFDLLDRAAEEIIAMTRDLKHGEVSLSVDSLTPDQVKLEKLRGMFGGSYAYQEVMDLQPGKFARLVVGGELMMTTTNMERRTNAEFVRRAHGKVLVAGLGLGMVLKALEKKPEVKRVVVLEKSRDVIDAVWLRLKLDSRFRVSCTDALKEIPNQKTMGKFDVIYFDIWPTICAENWAEAKIMRKNFRKLLNKENPEHWMGTWREESIKRMARGRE